MIITEETLSTIESVFDLKLYDTQREWILNNKFTFQPDTRRQGKTFAYCIKLALSDGEEIDMTTADKVRKYQDMYYRHHTHYHVFFKQCFYQIYMKLKEAGLPVRKAKF